MTTNKKPRIALITAGLGPVADYFSTLPGIPVGVVNWNENTAASANYCNRKRIKNIIHAKLLGRQFATLEHLCANHNLLYADILKRNVEALHATLTAWECDLVITSRCSFVPSAALPHLSHGAINMHPSWLPDYRGGEPILWHIIDNQKELGTTIHRLTDKYDRGPVLAQQRTQRPHAASKANLLDITDALLGRELLANVIELLTTNPKAHGIEQPNESPTRYARAISPEALANETQINSLSAQSLWNLIHYFGYCPPQWLGLSGWQTLCQWRAVRMNQRSATTEKIAWSVNSAESSIYLHSDQATIELKPSCPPLHKLFRRKLDKTSEARL